LGTRGNFNFLKWDVSAFVLKYNNRFGTLLQTESNAVVYTYRTNIGNSITKGLELFLQGNWNLTKNSSITVFTSSTWMDGKYTSGNIKSGTNNVSIIGNKIESVPNIISRNGISFQYKQWSISSLYSYTSKTYADALNTEYPSLTGSIGLVPSYGIFDMNFTCKVSKFITLKGSLNNITNKNILLKDLYLIQE